MRQIAPVAALLFWGCSGSAPDERPEKDVVVNAEAPSVKAPADLCPKTGEAPTPLPGIQSEHRDLAYWLTQLGQKHDLDEVLMTPAQIEVMNVALERPDAAGARIEFDLRAAMPMEILKEKVAGRLKWLRGQFDAKKYVESDGSALSAAAKQALALQADWLPGGREVRIALAEIPLRCGPRQPGFYTPSLDLKFDRNNCSMVRAQEALEVLGPWANGMQLARTRYALGWIPQDAPLSAPLSADEIDAWVDGQRLQVAGPVTLKLDGGGEISVPLGTRLLAMPEGRVKIAGAKGMATAPAPTGSQPTGRALTRRALFTEAFSYLNSDYGWGGQDAGRDCSRFLLDVFGAFGLDLPRFSGDQAKAGTFQIEVASIKDESERIRLIEMASTRGVVLLHFPGHIMLYLGQDQAGTAMALHSFAEYLVPCDPKVPTHNAKKETLLSVNKVTVSDLSLGRGTSRTAFIERLTHITVIGKNPGVALRGVAKMRQPAPLIVPTGKACQSGKSYPIFQSPLQPNAREDMRLVVTSSEEDAPAEIAVRDPSGMVRSLPIHRLGGPPYSYIATIPNPEVGTWTVAFGEGSTAKTCRRLKVTARAPRRPSQEGPVWRVRNSWGPQTESFYAAFVESLFDYPIDEDHSWENLHSLLADPSHNLLFNHLGRNEDDKIRLKPDCADLPYFLRGYFAWKLGLPFGFRTCSRGRAGRPPRCGELVTNTMDREATDDLDAVNIFLRRRLKSAVHSSSARTAPKDSESDVYPIPLRRETLRPGTTYADPYGHLLVLTRWVPQGADGYGILMAADAQPDGTIGRRRFWRGSFLFTPETRDVGAGFKAFRPLVRRDGEWVQKTNAQLKKARGIAPYSTQQYTGSADDFYDTVQGLINPRPLDPTRRMTSLVQALHEVVSRRVTAIKNGEEFMAKRNFRPIDMPSGSSIFLTAGPWEDFSTPSRDMRLLISMHTVMSFPESVERSPEQYGLSAEDVGPIVEALKTQLSKELTAKTIEYTRSDGSPQMLTLKQVADRRVVLEMAYNPNDCVELRWGAPEGSPERSTCKRHAPAGQHRKMVKYRPWFAERRRPAR